MQTELFTFQEQILPEELHEGRGQKVVEDWCGTSKSVGNGCSGDGPYRKIQIEEAGGGSRYKEDDLFFFS